MIWPPSWTTLHLKMTHAVRIVALMGLRRRDLLRMVWTHAHLDKKYIELKTGKSNGRRQS